MKVVSRLKRGVFRVVDAVVQRAVKAYYTEHAYSARWHPYDELLARARSDTVDYIQQAMGDAMIRGDAFDVLDYASEHVSVDGMYLEFGVRSGGTINHIARRHPENTIVGFDSFEGLPEPWAGYTEVRGAFSGEGMPAVEANVRLVVGWFDDTLPTFLDSDTGVVAFVHIDSDLYRSAKVILEQLAPRFVAGTIIVFNEYFNYPNWREHEFKAFQEFCSQHGVRYDYLCWGMYEVAVQLTSIDPSATT